MLVKVSLIAGDVLAHTGARPSALAWPHTALQWRHNGRDGVSNHRRIECFLNRLFRRGSKKTSNLRVTGLCEGNSPVTVNSPHKGPVTRKTFPFDDVIMEGQQITWRPFLELLFWYHVRKPSPCYSLEDRPRTFHPNSLAPGRFEKKNPISNFQSSFSDWWLRHPLWNCHQMNVTGPY